MSENQAYWAAQSLLAAHRATQFAADGNTRQSREYARDSASFYANFTVDLPVTWSTVTAIKDWHAVVRSLQKA